MDTCYEMKVRNNRITYFIILCFVDRSSLYNRVNKANLVHSFS